MMRGRIRRWVGIDAVVFEPTKNRSENLRMRPSRLRACAVSWTMMISSLEVSGIGLWPWGYACFGHDGCLMSAIVRYRPLWFAVEVVFL